MKSLKVSEDYPFRAFPAYYGSLSSGLVKKVIEGERLFHSLRARKRMSELTTPAAEEMQKSWKLTFLSC